ncbi:MAG: hypothetical protein SGPRY_000195 [Prymnesium sp.]
MDLCKIPSSTCRKPGYTTSTAPLDSALSQPISEGLLASAGRTARSSDTSCPRAPSTSSPNRPHPPGLDQPDSQSTIEDLRAKGKHEKETHDSSTISFPLSKRQHMQCHGFRLEMAFWLGVSLVSLLCLMRSQMVAKRSVLPHILLVVADDLGPLLGLSWADVEYHTPPSGEVHTPTISALVREGVELHRHYAHMICTPSRSSLQTGRLPVHLITQLADPCDKAGAIPRNMTGLAEQLQRAGYATHQVGKWDAGMSTPRHTPHGRGFDTSLNYFGHGNWMWSEREWGGSEDHGSWPRPRLVDLWDTDAPATASNGTGYEEELFLARMLAILRAHDPSTPLFLNYASRLAHYPLQVACVPSLVLRTYPLISPLSSRRQVPPEYERRFAHIRDANRRVYTAMVRYLDDQLAAVTNAMRRRGMWEDTLMIFTSDNGGFVNSPLGPCSPSARGTTCFNGESGASNWPLRGGKYSMFEGGIRVSAFVSGGFLPPAVRGTRLDGMMHIADWYATLCALAHVDPTDKLAASSHLPPIDSLNMWPMLSGENLTSPRTSILISRQLLLHDQWKYVRGNAKMRGAAWGGPFYPNASTECDPIDAHSIQCPARGCLFDVVSDLEETREVSTDYPDVVDHLRLQLDQLTKTIWETKHENDPLCWKTAETKYGGFYGPWLEI